MKRFTAILLCTVLVVSAAAAQDAAGTNDARGNEISEDASENGSPRSEDSGERLKLLDRAGPFGIGGVIGEPTGITVKTYLAENIALDATFSWSFISHDTFYFHADYLHHTGSLYDAQPRGLKFYAGIGGMVQISADPTFGPRIPLGITYSIPDIPLELFFEAAPILLLYPETAPSGSIGIGARYFLGGGPGGSSNEDSEAEPVNSPS